jgi:hypothetical protein
MFCCVVNGVGGDWLSGKPNESSCRSLNWLPGRGGKLKTEAGNGVARVDVKHRM